MKDKEANKQLVEDSDCLEAMDHLYAYLSGELKDKDSLAMMEHHLSHCKSCFSRSEIEKEINTRLQSTKQLETPESLKTRLDDILKEMD